MPKYFDVEIQIAIPGMKTSTTKITVEAVTVPEAASKAEQVVSVIAIAVVPNDSGVPLSVPLNPIALDKAVGASVVV